MFNPCKPCCCPSAPCEQCMFGYRSAESNHESMLQLITAVKNGEKPFGWKCAQNYMDYHKNWEEELKQYLDETREEEVKEPEKKEPDNPNTRLTIDLGPNDKLTNFRLAEAVHNLCSTYECLDASTVSCMLGDQARFDYYKFGKGSISSSARQVQND